MNKYKNYLSDLGFELKKEALEVKKRKDTAIHESNEFYYQAGRLMAYYEIITTMKQQANGFDIPLEDLRLEDINPDQALV